MLNRMIRKFGQALGSLKASASMARRTPEVRPEVIEELKIAQLLALLPSLNFFSEEIPMRVRGDWLCRSLYLRLPKGKEGALDPGGIEIYRIDGKRIGLEKAERVVASTSSRGCNPRDLLKGAGFSTQHETAPWWRIDFTDVERLGEIRVFNKKGPKGHFNRFLRVSRITPEGKECLIDAPLEQGRRILLENPVLRDSVALTEPLDVEQLQVHRRNVFLPNVCRNLHGRLPDFGTMHELIFVTDIWAHKRSSKLSPMQLKVLANFLASAHIARKCVRLKDFMPLLPTKASVLKLESEMNGILEREGKSPVILTNHGVSAAGKLTGRVAQTLDVLDDAIDELEKMGLAPVLAYGSLLGARREKAFIPHDDDVDILYRVEASGRADAEERIEQVCEHFRKIGWKVGAPEGFLNRHLYHPEEPVVIDAFPMWKEEGEWQLHMESMHIRGVPANVLEQRSRVQLYDRSYPAPGEIDAFLEERYGADWKTPDRFFGWGWNFQD